VGKHDLTGSDFHSFRVSRSDITTAVVTRNSKTSEVFVLELAMMRQRHTSLT
jgi:hypothetical protein